MSESEQTRVVAVLDDMFFASKIKEAAKQTGVNLMILKNSDGLVDELSNFSPVLIIIDLNSKSFNALDLLRDLKSSSNFSQITTLGYMPHVEEELKKDALGAGCDVVMPRSRFARELPNILAEHSSRQPS